MNNQETAQTVEKTEFTMPGNWSVYIPLKTIPYYVWMKEQGITNPHKIETKKAFLASQGFNKEIHTLVNSTEILKIMGYCEDMYYQWEILAKQSV